MTEYFIAILDVNMARMAKTMHILIIFSDRMQLINAWKRTRQKLWLSFPLSLFNSMVKVCLQTCVRNDAEA